MADCKPISTPMEVNVKLSAEDTSPLVDTRKYRKLVGGLIFLTNTRLDISFSVGVLSRFSNKPRESHWKEGMRVLRYIKGTLDYGINYGEGDTLIGYCDSDWAGDSDSRKVSFWLLFLAWLRTFLLEQQETTYSGTIFN